MSTETSIDHKHVGSDNVLSEGRRFRDAVEASELRFSFHDGVIGHICPVTTTSDQLNRVMNFKKGILSSFQTSMDDFTKPQNLTEVSGIVTHFVCKQKRNN